MTQSIPEARADQLARHVLNERLHLRPKENVLIEAYPSALPWAAGFVREARRKGAIPVVHYEDEASYWRATEEGRAGLLGTMGAAEKAALAAADVYIYFWGPENLARRWKMDGSDQDRTTAFNATWYEVARKSGLRGARMGIARVTEANARTFGVSYRAWLDEMFAASVRDPRASLKDLERVRRALEHGSTVRFRHSNGSDLTLGLRQRPAREGIGRVTPAEMKTPFGMLASVPEGATWVAIDEETADGTLVANLPTWVGGSPRKGGVWTFRDGRLVKWRYSAGGGEFASGYAKGGKGRDQPSFVQVGLDPSLRMSPMMEESHRGAVAVGVGGNTGFGGANKANFLEMLIVEGGELRVDGRAIVRAGRIL
jgi:leucyl aminopeptidase (aminopeptidase T)